MRPLSFIGFLLVGLIWANSVAAQGELPLSAPLIGLNSVDQDRIILYDVQNNYYRELNFGTEAHWLWDFSPDGCQILFSLGQHPAAKLYLADLKGRAIYPLLTYPDLADSQWGVWDVSWSPDGQRIAFVMYRQQDGKQLTHIAWVDAAGGVPQFYSATGSEYEPRWSADGQKIAYISYTDRAAGADLFSTAVPTLQPLPGQTPTAPTLLSEADIWVVNADGSDKFKLTDFQTGTVSKARWSPDGELMAFIFSPSPSNDTVWMIGTSPGALPTQLTLQWSLALDLTWMPDGTEILASLRDFKEIQQNQLWRLPLIPPSDEGAQLYRDDLSLQYADYPRFDGSGEWLALRSAYTLQLVNHLSGVSHQLEPIAIGNTPPIWAPTRFEGEENCS
ncbi:hypothetical protein MASR2M15_10490 [Anaerolineales bacterium]